MAVHHAHQPKKAFAAFFVQEIGTSLFGPLYGCGRHELRALESATDLAE